LCRTYGNVVTARSRKLPITVVDCPPFLLNGECDDHSTDRLGQMPYTQHGFDQLGVYLASEIERSLRQQPDEVQSSDASRQDRFQEYLAGLRVQVALSNPSENDRVHIDRLLRTAADFSLTGEKPYLQDEEVDRLITTHKCFLVSVSDRLSRYGNSGVVLLSVAKDQLVVDSLALSCVVLGKQVEFAVLSALSQYASKNGLHRIVFKFEPTPRNLPMRKFLEAVTVAEAGVGYVVDVDSVGSRLREAAVSPETWNYTLQTSDEHSGMQRI
jgi:predicted enzyme involved in methoxymalonyl-ACP biosynthesis